MTPPHSPGPRDTGASFAIVLALLALCLIGWYLLYYVGVLVVRLVRALA